MEFDFTKSYFECFQLEAFFSIDQLKLADQYQLLQLQFHPDRFVNANDQDKRIAMQVTSHINEAFKTLKDDQMRARYLLQMQGVEFDEDKDTTQDMEFLVGQMELREAIDAMIDANYEPVNNGVYKSGFARTQSAYDEAVTALFARLDELEILLEGREWLVGEGVGQLTEADICLFTTLARFDLVYVVHFKCNLRRIIDYPNLQAFVERMIEQPGVRETCHWHHIKAHYFWSHQNINTFRIIPLGPLEGAHTK